MKVRCWSPAPFFTATAVHRQAVSSRLNPRRNFLTKQPVPLWLYLGKNYVKKKKSKITTQVWKQLPG